MNNNGHKLRPYKFQIVPVCQELDGDGEVVGEQTVTGREGQPLVVYGIDGLREFADLFPARLQEPHA